MHSINPEKAATAEFDMSSTCLLAVDVGCCIYLVHILVDTLYRWISYPSHGSQSENRGKKKHKERKTWEESFTFGFLFCPLIFAFVEYVSLKILMLCFGCF